MSNTECRLTTVDNPYDVFTQFDQWFLYDVEKGYNTCGYLDRIANIPQDVSDEEYARRIEEAIDEIIKYDTTNLYRKVKRTQSQ